MILRAVATAMLLLGGTAAAAATGGEVDPKFLIPVPTEQKKIKIGEAKVFADGALSLGVVSADRTGVEVSVAGRDPVRLPASTQTLTEIPGGLICTMVYLGLSGDRAILSARCDPASESLQAALAAQLGATPAVVVDPAALVTETPRGGLANPYLGDARAIEEGHALFLANSCNGCHGGSGGGGMGPALTNGVWVYGREDDTLFRLVTLGSEELQAQGWSRVAREKVVGPMPAYTGIIEDADQLWKILAWVRSVSPTDAPPAK